MPLGSKPPMKMAAPSKIVRPKRSERVALRVKISYSGGIPSFFRILIEFTFCGGKLTEVSGKLWLGSSPTTAIPRVNVAILASTAALAAPLEIVPLGRTPTPRRRADPSELALQTPSVHAQSPGSLGDIAIAVGQHPLQMLALELVERGRARARGRIDQDRLGPLERGE